MEQNSFLEMMGRRYTCKEYDPTYRVSAQEIDALKEILRLSPSSINSQPWAFGFVGDEETKSELAKHSFINEAKVSACSHVIVLCVVKDKETFEQIHYPQLSERVQAYYNNVVSPQGESAVVSWLEKQVYIALGVLLSALGTMGIDSTPMEGIFPKGYDEVLDNGDYRTLVAVAIGRRSQTDPNAPELVPKTRRQDVIL